MKKKNHYLRANNIVLMPDVNPVIKKPTSGILPGVYRYTYVLNNPLKYTDPSGYTKVARDYAGESMYWMMQSMTGRIMDMSYGLTSFGGGGFSTTSGGGNYQSRVSNMHQNPNEWEFDDSIGAYRNKRTGEIIDPITNYQDYKNIIVPILYKDATVSVYEGGFAVVDGDLYLPGDWNTYKVTYVVNTLGPIANTTNQAGIESQSVENGVDGSGLLGAVFAGVTISTEAGKALSKLNLNELKKLQNILNTNNNINSIDINNKILNVARRGNIIKGIGILENAANLYVAADEIINNDGNITVDNIYDLIGGVVSFVPGGGWIISTSLYLNNEASKKIDYYYAGDIIIFY